MPNWVTARYNPSSSYTVSSMIRLCLQPSFKVHDCTSIIMYMYIVHVRETNPFCNEHNTLIAGKAEKVAQSDILALK